MLQLQMAQAETALGRMYIEIGDFDADRAAFSGACDKSKDPLGPLLSLARLDKIQLKPLIDVIGDNRIEF